MQYKSTMIMRKLITRFKLPQLRKNAAKVIKIQIKLLNKAQRKDNARIVSIPFAYCKLSHKDDWLVLEGSPEDLAQ